MFQEISASSCTHGWSTILSNDWTLPISSLERTFLSDWCVKIVDKYRYTVFKLIKSFENLLNHCANASVLDLINTTTRHNLFDIQASLYIFDSIRGINMTVPKRNIFFFLLILYFSTDFASTYRPERGSFSWDLFFRCFNVQYKKKTQKKLVLLSAFWVQHQIFCDTTRSRENNPKLCRYFVL